ncbi:MAG TPA: carboxypeptidase-like regulatory domain-containing protein [Thermoanaerobaculia bacterium]|nr:carboxypeptidase-like regulatory domain-containing protein [Thermoanaerobaculia bacterium]
MRFGTRDPGRTRRLFFLVLLSCECATRPSPTPEAVRRSVNPPAIVEGRVVDPQGAAIAGISVKGLPRDKDLGWSPASVTDGGGRFRLELVAPGEYGFLLFWNGVAVVTSRADDPSRILVKVGPGERRGGLQIVFRRDEWERRAE